ncbi:MAG: protein-L-isoaspartate O-methyltransferase, partial [Patescibacteria group bacterium]
MFSLVGLIDHLTESGYLKTPAIRSALEAVDRSDFVPIDLKDQAYVDEPLPIGFGQTISQPLTVVFMLELLGPEVGNRILDIGSGSGWQTALLAHIVSDGGKPTAEGRVFAIERIPQLKKMAESNVHKYGFPEKGIVEIILGNGSKGCLEYSPYDGIIAAAAGKDIPVAWKDQLKIGGKIVAPVGQSIRVCEKIS